MAGSTPVFSQGAPSDYWSDPQGIDALIAGLYSIYNGGYRAVPYYRGRGIGPDIGMTPTDAISLAHMYEQQRDAGPGQGGSGGGNAGIGGGAGGPGPSGGTLAAVAAGSGRIFGGSSARGVTGPGAQVRADVGRIRAGEFTGLDTLSPDMKLDPTASPFMQNWNTIETPGSISVRRGTMKFNDNRDTVNSGSLGAGYKGLGVLYIPPNDYSGSGAMFQSYADLGAGLYGGSANVEHFVCDAGPTYSRPRSFYQQPAPSVTLSSPSTGTIRANCTYTNILQINTVAAWVVRYSSVRQPRDIDGYDDSESEILDDADYFASITGEIFDEPGLVSTTTYYVTAWAVSRLGVSKPFYGKVVAS